MRLQEDFGSWFVEGEGYKDVLRYASIPIVAALIGYGTNVLAIQMTFLPLEYLGFGEAFFHKWGFSLGWQVHARTRAQHASLHRTRRCTHPHCTAAPGMHAADTAAPGLSSSRCGLAGHHPIQGGEDGTQGVLHDHDQADEPARRLREGAGRRIPLTLTPAPTPAPIPSPSPSPSPSPTLAPALTLTLPTSPEQVEAERIVAELEPVLHRSMERVVTEVATPKPNAKP